MDPGPGSLSTDSAPPPAAVVRYRDRPDQLWRNGNGTTRELHRGPGWRLSLATLAGPAEFSTFPRTHRTFVVAAGTVDLTVDGARHRLDTGAILEFPGEVVVVARPLGGPAHALNVMTDGSCTARVAVRELSPDVPAADAVVLLQGRAVGAAGEELQEFDSVVPAPAGWVVGDGTLGAVVSIVEREGTA